MTLVGADWHAARVAAHTAGVRLSLEEVPLEEGLHRCVGAPVRALTPLPASPCSAMDGWAVAGPGPWRVVGRLLAGQSWPSALGEGEALSVATGTALPKGAAAVLRLEDGAWSASRLLTGHVVPGQHIRPAGEECVEGEELVAVGTRLTPIHLGLAAAAGQDTVTVIRRPRVRVLVLGDELLMRGPARDGRVRDSLGVQLAGWLGSWGCVVMGVTHVPDVSSSHVAAFECAKDADLVITTGGTSVGPADLLRAAVLATGGRFVVDGVDCRPGHPMLLAGWDGRWLVGLPGNPHAAIAALMTLALPLVEGLHGLPLAALPSVHLAGRVTSRGASTRLVPCRLDAGHAVPCSHIGSGMLRGLAEADGLAVVPAEAIDGSAVEWMPWPWAC